MSEHMLKLWKIIVEARLIQQHVTIKVHVNTTKSGFTVNWGGKNIFSDNLDI